METTVRARRVGDSVVMTLPKGILESTGFEEGDSLLLQTRKSGFLSVQKEIDNMNSLKESQLELDILYKKLEVVKADLSLAAHEYNSHMPTRHPGIDEDSAIMEGYSKENWLDQCEIQLEIAQKELELFRMGGPVPNRVLVHATG